MNKLSVRLAAVMGAVALTSVVFAPSAYAGGLAASQSSHHRAAKGWQPGGPLRPIYQLAVADVHSHEFDAAEALCHQGLKLSPGDTAFTDLLSQIPQWREDSRQAQITAKYNQAVGLVHSGHLDQATEQCHEGLQMDPGNVSFRQLLRDIAQNRHDRLEARLVACYKQSSLLLAQGEYSAAETRCREGLRLSPNDTVLNSLLAKIQGHE